MPCINSILEKCQKLNKVCSVLSEIYGTFLMTEILIVSLRCREYEKHIRESYDLWMNRVKLPCRVGCGEQFSSMAGRLNRVRGPIHTQNPQYVLPGVLIRGIGTAVGHNVRKLLIDGTLNTDNSRCLFHAI